MCDRDDMIQTLALQGCNQHETQFNEPGEVVAHLPGFVFPTDCGSEKSTPLPVLYPETVMRARAHALRAEARAREDSIKLDTSVVNRQFQQREVMWEKLDSKMERVYPMLNEKLQAQARNFGRCNKESVYRVCRGCGGWEELPYQCSIKWCPRCVFKLSRMRQEVMAHWTKRIAQPKHVVVTQVNIGIIGRDSFTQNTENIRRLQRSKVFAGVRGGCSSTEVTNKSRGWHLHNHLLVDADWVDSGDLARTWAKIVGQRFAIVKCKDAREKDYRAEVAKYVVKSSELVSWTPRQIASFITSLYRTRLFVTFGSLRTEPKFVKPKSERVCACGCSEFQHQTETGAVLAQIKSK